MKHNRDHIRRPRRTAALIGTLGVLGTTVVALAVTAPVPAGAAAIGKDSAFCKAAAAAVGAPLPDTPDDQTKYTAADKAKNKAYAAILVSSIDIMLKDAPASIKAELTAQRTFAAGVVKTGVEGDEAAPGLGNGTNVADFVGKTCAYGQLAVTASDYKFAGIAPTVKAGFTSLALKNTSKTEMHHMVVAKRHPTQKTPVLKLLEQENPTGIDFLGFVGENAPGETKGGIMNLTPGSYVVVCFIPVGGKETGAPHFTKGMYGEFTVK